MNEITQLSVCTIVLSYDDTKLIDYVLLLLDHAGETRVVRGLKRLNLFEKIIEAERFRGRLPPG